METKKASKKSTIEQILERNTISNDDIKLAMEMYQAQEKDRKAKALLNRLKEIDSLEEKLVTHLRNVRKTEKNVQKRLLAFNEAREKFLQSGDDEDFAAIFNGSII